MILFANKLYFRFKIFLFFYSSKNAKFIFHKTGNNQQIEIDDLKTDLKIKDSPHNTTKKHLKNLLPDFLQAFLVQHS